MLKKEQFLENTIQWPKFLGLKKHVKCRTSEIDKGVSKYLTKDGTASRLF